MLGICSLFFLLSKCILYEIRIEGLSREDILLLGRIGAVFGLFSFFTGGGLGKFLSDKRSKIAEVHTILMLAGLILQTPSLGEDSQNYITIFLSWIGMVLLLSGWMYGRRVFDRFPFRRKPESVKN
ncbi:hypothetical protein [Leptospira perolatii]|uniref:hypothetical protein n=1 Tax=Leptospira perolatii TaxID=2023191 RepID=UPI001FAEC0E9|nr:hypothetical protein [Leptospira perolatii]